MASRPMLAALCRWIAARGQEQYGRYTDEDGVEQYVDPHGELWVFEQIARGIPVGRIASSIELDPPYGTPSRRMLYMWRDEDQSGQRAQMWTSAMEAAADEMMDRSVEDAEGIAADQGQVSRMKLIIEQRRAVAARQHPTAWGKRDLGEQLAEGAALGFGLLAALNEYGHREASGMKRLEAERQRALPVEAEIVDDGGEG